MNVVTVPAKVPEIELPLSLRAASACVENHAGKENDEVFDVLVQCAGTISQAAERVKSTCEKVLANEMAMPVKRAADAPECGTQNLHGRGG
jgi:hypothetical protein